MFLGKRFKDPVLGDHYLSIDPRQAWATEVLQRKAQGFHSLLQLKSRLCEKQFNTRDQGCLWKKDSLHVGSHSLQTQTLKPCGFKRMRERTQAFQNSFSKLSLNSRFLGAGYCGVTSKT